MGKSNALDQMLKRLRPMLAEGTVYAVGCSGSWLLIGRIRTGAELAAIYQVNANTMAEGISSGRVVLDDPESMPPFEHRLHPHAEDEGRRLRVYAVVPTVQL